MKEEKNWMRTFFMAYDTIDKLLKNLDKQVLTDSLNSKSTSGTEETLRLADAVLNKIQRKRKFSALKYMIEESLKSIKKERAQVLYLKYVDNFSEEEIAGMCHTSVRTLHRKISEGLNECYVFFAMNGCDIVNIRKYFSEEPLIKDLYEKVCRFSKKEKKQSELPASCQHFATV